MALSISAIFGSCVAETMEPEWKADGLVRKVFHADFAGGTRTSLVDGRKVFWTEGDRISVFDGCGT